MFRSNGTIDTLLVASLILNLSAFFESNQLRMAVDEQTEAGINDYLNKNLERLHYLLSQHIANIAGTNDAIHNLVKVTAQSAVDHYSEMMIIRT